jgi:chitinase
MPSQNSRTIRTMCAPYKYGGSYRAASKLLEPPKTIACGGRSARYDPKLKPVSMTNEFHLNRDPLQFWQMRRILVLLLFSFLLRAAAAESPHTNKVFVGYLYRTPGHINFSLYTHLCHAFITADADGRVRTNRNVPSRDLTAQAHQAGVKVLISLGGWGWDEQFAAMMKNQQAEDRYVGAVIEMVDAFDYDGIDLDWEYPDTADEVVGFERLSRRFRRQLDELSEKKGRPMIQTMAASCNPNTLKWLSNQLLLDTMDWVNVMTYDMAGEWTDYAGHHSPLFASSKQPGAPHSTELTIKYLIARGMPAHRLALGIPLYGKGFAVSEPYASTKDVGDRRPPRDGNYGALDRMQKEQGWVRQWDDQTKNPWLIAPDGSAVIGYDDSESIALKTEWAMKLGLRGVFFWQIGADLLPDGSNPLQETSREKFDQFVRPGSRAQPLNPGSSAPANEAANKQYQEGDKTNFGRERGRSGGQAESKPGADQGNDQK